MLDETSFELLNAEIDGTLSPADRSELSRRLLESPQLRAVRDELRLACAELERLPLAEPPAGLREKILAALPPARGGAAESQSRRGFTFGPRNLRFAAALVGGVLVSAIAFQASRTLVNPAADQLAGTMAQSPPAVAPAAGTLRVDASRVQGTITLVEQATGLSVAFALDAAQPESAVAANAVVVTATRGQQVVRLERDTASQQGAFGAVLPGPVSAGEVVNIRVEAAGVPVYQGRWQAPATR